MTTHSAQELLECHGIDFINTAKGKYTTECPECHGGGYLNVTLNEDGVVWYCHNCNHRGGEKYEKPENSKLRPINYDYTDENGKLLFQVLRFEPPGQPKQFRQRTGPDQRPWSIKGVRIVPYRLPELIENIARGNTIFVVEGEKDVDTLRQHCVPATCNPMGAGKWWPEFNHILKGADIVVCGDNDAPGRAHVKLVANNLSSSAGRLRILDLAKFWPQIQPSDDISDWLESHAVDELWTVVEGLPDYQAGGTGQEINSPFSQLPTGKPPGENWPELPKEALIGLPGEVVRTLDPHTEADPNAVLLQFLTMAGNAIGHEPFYQVEGDKHHAKLFCVLVGATSKGRKGTSAGRVRQIMGIADPDWQAGKINGGLSSGEGLIFHVRDPVTKTSKGSEETIDSGVTDKRLMLQVEEFASALSVMERPGNTLSPVIRDAWGPNPLQTLTKNSPVKATGSHVSMVAHVTEPELRSSLTRIEMGNGFANRYLFLKVKRSKLLPHGGNLDRGTMEALGAKTKEAIDNARRIGHVEMNEDAKEIWARVYEDLSAERPGLLGAVLGRAEAQVIRISLIYAVLDNSAVIDVPHLKAGLAVWEFCEESARQIFGDSLGDPVADTILSALRAAGPLGKSRAAISDLFGRHQTSAQIREALNLLFRHRKARTETVQAKGPGRSTEMWFAIDGAR